MPNKQERLAYTTKAQAIVSQMTLDEKIDLMSGKLGLKEMADMLTGKGYNARPWGAGGNKRLGIPKMLFCDGPRGVVSGNSTCFPVTMARGAAFDTGLEERVGEAIGKEVRANGGNYFGGVCINLPYNPGWGRSQEVYGEDSMHMGKLGVALVRGVQKHNVIACLKHYAFNTMECKRFSVSVTADKRTEREIYLRHFKQCVDAGAASVMGAYNKYEGTHCCHNSYLLRDVLKKEWDFDGFVISDFMWGVRNAVGGISGGCDIEMPQTVKYTRGKVKKALKAGSITLEQIDDAVLRIVRTLLAFSEAQDPQEYPLSLCQSKEHLDLAEEVARKSLTLVKNEQVLPFDRAPQSIVVVGDLAKVQNIGDHGSSWIKRGNPDTILEQLVERFSAEKVIHIADKDVPSSLQAIKDASAVIFVMGLGHGDEGEFVSEKVKTGGDRKKTLGLHANEVEILSQYGSLNPNSAVVLIGGNMLLLDPWYDRVPAILMAYYPGARGGKAVVDTLFGDNNPSGKTPFVTVKDEKDLPQVDWDADEQFYEYYHGYARLDKQNKEARVPYGFGLSYTTFELTDARFIKNQDNKAHFEVRVTNTGKVKGGEVAQLYVGWNDSAVDRPERSLMDFNKVYLEPGKSRLVELVVAKSDLAYWDEKRACFVEEDITYTAFIGNSAHRSSQVAVDFHF